MNEMASQVIGGAVSQLQVLEIHSFLRGYHAYIDIWTPVVGEILVYRLEVPCVYRVYEPNIYVDQMKVR